jgi:hypothetical protein
MPTPLSRHSPDSLHSPPKAVTRFDATRDQPWELQQRDFGCGHATPVAAISTYEFSVNHAE